MKTAATILVIFLLSVGSGFAQMDTLFTRTFGGAGSEGGRSIEQTVDGGYIIAGYTYSFGAGNADIYLIKTDSDGNEQWSNCFGGSGWEYGNSVCQTADNGYIIAGYTTSYGAGSKDVYLVKADSLGNQEWAGTFGGSGLDVGKAVIETGAGGYVVCGYTESFSIGEDDIYLIKTDSGGNEIWSETFGGYASDVGLYIRETDDDGYIIAGATGSFGSGNRDIYLVTVDSSGNQIDVRTFGVGSSNYEWGNSISETSDGGHIIVGDADIHSSDLLDFYIVKTDSEENLEWQLKLGASNFYDYGVSILEASDGGFLACGTSKSNVTLKNDVYLIKIHRDGYQLWSQAIGGPDSDWGFSLCETSDGDYVVIGQTGSYGAGAFDVWLIKLAGEVNSVRDKGAIIPEAYLSSSNFPNPFNARTIISYNLVDRSDVRIDIFDLIGRKVKTFFDMASSAGKHTVVWDAADASSGIYFYRVQAGGRHETKKMTLLK
ncbi:MAG: T9SS type A sorting domain-containing protein [candidate division Zixibacteria bacterium]|nr:T9SS type A sorting domain-containing protein [candidate division Zixibacteria bacterium]